MENINETSLQQGLIRKISALTDILESNIKTTIPLADYGLDSLQAVSLSGEIEEWLGIPLEPTIVWDYPTIEELSKHLLEQVEGKNG